MKLMGRLIILEDQRDRDVAFRSHLRVQKGHLLTFTRPLVVARFGEILGYDVRSYQLVENTLLFTASLQAAQFALGFAPNDVTDKEVEVLLADDANKALLWMSGLQAQRKP